MTPEQLATDLKSLLLQKDFRPVQQPEDTPVFDLYIRIENPVCCVLAVQPHDSDEHREDVAAFAESLQKQLPQIQCTQLICLYLTIGPEPLAEVRPLADTDRMGNLHHIAWHYATDTQTLQVADGSPDKLMGIEKLLRMAATGEELPKDTLREDTTGKRPVVTFTIFCHLCCPASLRHGDGTERISLGAFQRQQRNSAGIGAILPPHHRHVLPRQHHAPCCQQHLSVLLRQSGRTAAGQSPLCDSVSHFRHLRRTVQCFSGALCLHRRIWRHLRTFGRHAHPHTGERFPLYRHELRHHDIAGIHSPCHGLSGCGCGQLGPSGRIPLRRSGVLPHVPCQRMRFADGCSLLTSWEQPSFFVQNRPLFPTGFPLLFLGITCHLYTE